MARGTGLQAFARRFPDRFFDVGIAEGHALTFAAGLARGGLRPVCAIYSPFSQRAVDNFFHDVCLQDLPVILCMDRAGLSCADGDAHHGLFDIALLSPFPNLIFAQPSSPQELRDLLWTALHGEHPFAIRYGRAVSGDPSWGQSPPQILSIGQSRLLRKGEDVSIWALGQRRLEQALAIADGLEARKISTEVVDARFLCPLDGNHLRSSAQCGLVVALEDHVFVGGFGGHLQRELARLSLFPNFLSIAWPFPIGFAETNGQLEHRCGQATAQIFKKILEAHGQSRPHASSVLQRMENFPTSGSNSGLSASKSSEGKGRTLRNFLSAADFGEKF
jgi:1-deoxy-D-xylulose-5-phosphate synthase